MLGQQAEFICHAIDSFWNHNNEPITQNIISHNNSIFIPEVKTSHEGRYTCEGKNPLNESVHGYGLLKLDGMMLVIYFINNSTIDNGTHNDVDIYNKSNNS